MSLHGDALALANAEFCVQLWRSWREGAIFPEAYHQKARWVGRIRGGLEGGGGVKKWGKRNVSGNARKREASAPSKWARTTEPADRLRCAPGLSPSCPGGLQVGLVAGVAVPAAQ